MRFRFPIVSNRGFGLHHILGTGQSLSLGQEGTPALSTTQPYDNLMFDTPGNPLDLSELNPLVEVTRESMSSSLANWITAQSATHRALVSVYGIGGTAYDNLKQGTAAYNLALAQVSAGMARASGLALTFGVPCVTVVHGEQDAIEGSLTYEDDIIEWQADYETDIKAITGQTGSIPHLYTQVSSVAESDVPLAQLRAHIADPENLILVGPKYHLPTPDGSHLTNEGYRQMGEEYAKVYHKTFILRETWSPLRPLSAVRLGAVITVTFEVPEPPLALDTAGQVAAMTDMGFEWDGAETITDVSVASPTTVEVTLSGTPAGAGRLLYAQRSGEVAGNLRDSDATESLHGYALYNWCVHFDEEVA